MKRNMLDVDMGGFYPEEFVEEQGVRFPKKLALHEDFVANKIPKNLGFKRPSSSMDRKKLHLDLDGVAKRRKVTGVSGLLTPSEITLNTPDLNMLCMDSPELERMILQFSSSTSSEVVTPSQLLASPATSAQENYVKGFSDELARLHSTKSTTSSVTASLVASNLDLSSVTLSHPTPPPPASSLTRPLPSLSQNLPLPQIVPSTNPPLYLLPSTTQYNTYMITSQPLMVFESSQSEVTVPDNQPTNQLRLLPASLDQRPPGYFATPSPSGGTYSTPPPPPLKQTGSIKREQPEAQCSMVTSSMTSSGVSIPPGFGTIDMAVQEKLKLERKRYRNRVAATKCRNRKIERIDTLEEQVTELRKTNAGLLSSKRELEADVVALKQKVLDHVKSGCHVMLSQSRNISALHSPSGKLVNIKLPA